MSRDTVADVAAILHPISDDPRPEDDDAVDAYDGELEQILNRREIAVQDLRAQWDADDVDPLITALASARSAKAEAERQIRLLIAYGREFVAPRPYTLGDLAAAAGMSVSGARTAYTHTDVDAVAAATGARSRDWRATDPTDPEPAAAGAAGAAQELTRIPR